MWIFYSNFILQENTAEVQILEKNQKKSAFSRIEVTTENLSRDRNAQVPAIPSHDINKFGFEEETENLNK